MPNYADSMLISTLPANRIISTLIADAHDPDSHHNVLVPCHCLTDEHSKYTGFGCSFQCSDSTSHGLTDEKNSKWEVALKKKSRFFSDADTQEYLRSGSYFHIQLIH